MDFRSRKIRLGRNAYLKDFQRDANGNFVYIGKQYVYHDSGKSRKRAIAELWVPVTLLLAVIVIQGFLPTEAMSSCGYVLLPYTGELISGITVFCALLRLSINKDPLMEYDYNPSVKALPTRALITACFAGATVVAYFVFLILNGADSLLLCLLLILLLLASVLISLLTRRMIRALVWDPHFSIEH